MSIRLARSTRFRLAESVPSLVLVFARCQRSWEDKLAEAQELSRRREEELSKVGITLHSSAADKEMLAMKAKEVSCYSHACNLNQ